VVAETLAAAQLPVGMVNLWFYRSSDPRQADRAGDCGREEPHGDQTPLEPENSRSSVKVEETHSMMVLLQALARASLPFAGGRIKRPRSRATGAGHKRP
jgi:hypothetical protein